MLTHSPSVIPNCVSSTIPFQEMSHNKRAIKAPLFARTPGSLTPTTTKNYKGTGYRKTSQLERDV